MSLVSVIIPTYNTERYIGKCIQSVLNQTYQDFEIILVDDCSTDNSLGIVRQFRDSRIKVYKNNINRGPSFSRNRAIEVARGEFIAILDSDDWWETNRLEIMMKFIWENNADIIFDNLLYIQDGEQVPYTTYSQFKGLTIHKDLKITPESFVEMDLGILKAVIRKKIITDHSIRYDDSIKYGEDFIFYLEVITKTSRAWLLKEGYYYYRSREGSLVKNFFALAKQCFQATKDLLEHPNYELTPTLQRALEKRRDEFKYIVTFHETAKYLKQGNLKKAIANLKENPKLLKELTLTKMRLFKYSLLEKMTKKGSAPS